MVGRTIHQYQFLEKLGAGGMGEIYKALDTRLNRYVAVKVLTTAASGDPERRRRFIQEAQAASALNHPNIITIHDIVSEGDSQFMVMEWVQGKTLVDLIPKGGLRVTQVLKYAVQMADALQAAHHAGIVHRDLKPGNVMVTESGLVKILDFGLAKLTEPAPLSTLTGPQDQTRTMAPRPLTVEGSIIGTVSYMSPEQAQGKKVDTRSDIFSFGVMLYEMTTGERAFHGESALTTLSAILRDETRPVAELAPEAPPQLEMVIQRCLRKNPDERWQTMKDVEMALAALKYESDSGTLYRSRLADQSSSAAHPGGKMEKRSGPSPVVVGVLGGTLALAGIVGGIWWTKHHRAAAPAAVTEAAVTAPAPPTEPATEPAAAPAPEPAKVADADAPMTNDQVIQMVEAKVSSTQIIATIRAAKATQFVLTPQELIRLANAMVPESVIEAMRNPKRAQVASASSTRETQPKSAPQNAAPKQVATVQPPVAAPPPQPAPQQPPPVTPPQQQTAQTPPAAPAKPPVAVVAVTLTDGIPFKITLAKDIPQDAEMGAPLSFTVTDDVKLKDVVVIAKGAAVTGVIEQAAKKKGFIPFGGGKMTLKLMKVDAVDGQKLSIRATPVRSENAAGNVEIEKNRPKGLAASAGTGYVAYIEGDQTVSAPRK